MAMLPQVSINKFTLVNHGQSDQNIEKRKSPNFWKCGQNFSPNSKNQIESSKHLQAIATKS